MAAAMVLANILIAVYHVEVLSPKRASGMIESMERNIFSQYRVNVIAIGQ
jgi:hypothetical protein